MADRTYELNFGMSDGTNKRVQFTVPQGDPGKSAYETAKEAGYPGTEEEFAEKLASDAYVVLAYGCDALTLFDAINSGKSVYCLYENYRLPMVTWTTGTITATFGGCFDNKIITCKFVGANWSASEETIDGDSNLLIVTPATTQTEMTSAFASGKVVVHKAIVAGGLVKWYQYAGIIGEEKYGFYRVNDGVIEEAVYSTSDGTWTYRTVEGGGAAGVFIGNNDTTLAEFKAAYDSGKTCFLRRSNPSGDVTYTAYNVTSTNAFFFAISNTGAIVYAYLDSSNVFTAQERKHVTTIDQNSTDAQIPTAKAVYDSVKGKLNATALTTAVNDALAQAKASGDFKGDPGKDGSDGVSVTHSWSGTTLTVTSASGTSSANLKGDKGDKGDTGAAGASGYSPVRGKDYWTDADKAEIKAYVDEAILGGAW